MQPLRPRLASPFVLVAVASFGLLAQSQTPPKPGVPPITIKAVPSFGKDALAAIAACRAFAKKVGLEIPLDKPYLTEGKTAYMRDYAVMFGKSGYDFLVNADTDEVYSFSNINASSQMRARFRREKPKVTNTLEAQIVANRILKRLGLDDYTVTSVKIRTDALGSSVSPGSVYCDVGKKVQGYYVKGSYCNGHLVFSGFDHQLLSYMAPPNPKSFTIEADRAKLTRDQAIEAARPIATKYRVGQDRSGHMAEHTYVPSGLTGLLWVAPNGLYGAPNYVKSKATRWHYRLAWVLRYRFSEEIWIDAGDGKVLGGYSMAGIS